MSPAAMIFIYLAFRIDEDSRKIMKNITIFFIVRYFIKRVKIYKVLRQYGGS